jgi:hypothetical protein
MTTRLLMYTMARRFCVEMNTVCYVHGRIIMQLPTTEMICKGKGWRVAFVLGIFLP